MAADPVSFKDPQYATLDSGVEAKLGLPSGLLSSIRTNGERSNADQVSEAGARTVYQITPPTRKLALDKWGIDPYLSKENAAEVAGLLLKDSLDRNKGNAAIATAEYHGGTDRANWGPRPRAYVQRVTAGLGAPPAADEPGVPAQQPAGQSTFDRVSAQMGQQQGSAIANILKAYQSGQMAPDEAKQFEADVKSGRVMLPRGAALTPAAAGDAAASAGTLPPEVMAAYSDGLMTRAEKIQLEDDVKAGLVKLPAGATLGTTERPGIVDNVKEALTGSERRT